MSEIKIRRLEVRAKHGVLEFEKTEPQPFVFDIDMSFDFFGAADSDGIDQTADYAAVCALVEKTAVSASYNLIEKLAYECACAIMDGFGVTAVKLTVWKPEAPVKQKFSNVGVTITLSREKVYLSLGSSEGDRKGYLDSAAEKLASVRGITLKKVSSYIETQPIGGAAQNMFLNCAAEIETYLPPRRLLKEINRIEAECGRVRNKRWGDRTLDIDIIFYGDKIISEQDLIVPHPEYAKREFVLAPLKEIAPYVFCPVNRKRLSDM